jgi:hypothetical protein
MEVGCFTVVRILVCRLRRNSTSSEQPARACTSIYLSLPEVVLMAVLDMPAGLPTTITHVSEAAGPPCQTVALF